MIDVTSEGVLGIGAGVTGALVTLNYLIRLFSRNRVEGRRDAAEIDIIKTLQDENRLLREQIALAYKQRDEARSRLDEARAQLAALHTEMALLKRDLSYSEQRMDALKSRIEELDRRKS